MWYDNERIPEEEGASKLLVGKTFAYFPKYVDNENSGINNKKLYEGNLDNIDNIKFDNKEYVLITQRLGRTIIPLNPELLAHSTFDQEIIDSYLNEIHENVHNYSILTEYSFLMNEIPRSFYCLPQPDNLLVWDVFIILYSTLYKNGKFKLQIRLGENYPHSIPEVYFLTPVFHPLINPLTGKLNLGLQLNKWNPTSHYMSLIFLYIKRIFHLQDEYTKEIIENEEAYFLFNNDKEMFLKNVKKSVEESNKAIYNKIDNSMFNFEENEDNTEIRKKLESIKNDQNCSKKTEAFIHWLINDYPNETDQDNINISDRNIEHEEKEIHKNKGNKGYDEKDDENNKKNDYNDKENKSDKKKYYDDKENESNKKNDYNDKENKSDKKKYYDNKENESNKKNDYDDKENKSNKKNDYDDKENESYKKKDYDGKDQNDRKNDYDDIENESNKKNDYDDKENENNKKNNYADKENKSDKNDYNKKDNENNNKNKYIKENENVKKNDYDDKENENSKKNNDVEIGEKIRKKKKK
ncbi:ubiquitin-conjugating enzyme E2, putative [Plasmodium relictum]|uniref:Ubiquitin-conjugating enzyme E2, putative n=1 Tax=Plasmodium relictum TaxID=85471 RepID=A0A1J1HCN6_PLARL|nr:ubiquitin-conjugating enzyme E2, putative [Plasmodium relictum]CRH02854.1 ubiquitin-conjugating enzyme E2, putative [Plasmodium relictum]